MATVELTSANFDEVTGNDGIVLVDFWADWCGPCKRFAPVYERSSEKHQNIVFGKVDTEAQQELGAKFDIRSIPTIMAIRDGVIVFSQPGALPESALESLSRPRDDTGGRAHHGPGLRRTPGSWRMITCLVRPNWPSEGPDTAGTSRIVTTRWRT